MDDRTEQRILEKAQYVREAVTVLAQKQDSLTLEEYRTQREQRDIVEREFETAIEACIDIGKMVLKADGSDVPATNAAVFRALESHEVLDDETAHRMAQAAGFRNVLSYQYGNDINNEDVYNFLQQNTPLFHAYFERIREDLER